MAAEQLWAKDLPLDQLLHRFTVGQDPVTDLALLPWDCVGSAAHARTLVRGGFLSHVDGTVLVQALAELHRMALAGQLTITPEQEDAHTALEAALTVRCGDAGKRIHLGRSRNDQVILAMRLLLRQRVVALGHQLGEIAKAFLDLAERHRDVPLPGYTHLRRAMPSSWGLWASAFAEGLLEELEALPGILGRLDRCPAGAGAGFGSPVPMDRPFFAALLGFSAVQRHPIDVISSRGRHETAVADWLASAARTLEQAMWDLSLYTMEEFGFARLPDAFTTGSSIMPQKRNPDVVELARGACRQIRGGAGQLREMAGGLPSSYHRDAQLLKAPTLALVEQAGDLLAVLPRLLEGLEVDGQRSAAACTDELYAAHGATRLAMEGLPFRDAYRIIGGQVLDGTFHPDRAALMVENPLDLDTPRQHLTQHMETLSATAVRWEGRIQALWTDPMLTHVPEQP